MDAERWIADISSPTKVLPASSQRSLFVGNIATDKPQAGHSKFLSTSWTMSSKLYLDFFPEATISISLEQGLWLWEQIILWQHQELTDPAPICNYDISLLSC